MYSIHRAREIRVVIRNAWQRMWRAEIKINNLVQTKYSNIILFSVNI